MFTSSIFHAFESEIDIKNFLREKFVIDNFFERSTCRNSINVNFLFSYKELCLLNSNQQLLSVGVFLELWSVVLRYTPHCFWLEQTAFNETFFFVRCHLLECDLCLREGYHPITLQYHTMPCNMMQYHAMWQVPLVKVWPVPWWRLVTAGLVLKYPTVSKKSFSPPVFLWPPPL